MRGSMVLQWIFGNTNCFLDYHWGLPGREKLACHSDDTVPQPQSSCPCHLRNHCQNVIRTTDYRACPLFTVPSSSLSERPLCGRFTPLWYHAQWSQTNHSHFPESFPHWVIHFVDIGLSLLLRLKSGKNVVVLLHCSPCFVILFSYCVLFSKEDYSSRTGSQELREWLVFWWL